MEYLKSYIIFLILIFILMLMMEMIFDFTFILYNLKLIYF
jgi:hypothetical protein